MQQKPHWLPACGFFSKKYFVLVYNFSISECCSSLGPSQSVAVLKFKGIWSSCKMKQKASEKGSDNSNLQPEPPFLKQGTIQVLPKTAKHVCQQSITLIFGSRLYSRYPSIIQLCPDPGRPKLLELYSYTHTHCTSI